MTSKSPVRSCEDVDETALSYAEIKALCAGNPIIAEKMNLDIDVARLRMLKFDYQSQHYRLEDDLLKNYPKLIVAANERIVGIENDIKLYEKHNTTDVIMLSGSASVAAKFSGMTINGITYAEKEPAAKALLEVCKELQTIEKTHIGKYMGFDMSLQFDSFSKNFHLLLRGSITHTVELGKDAFGNITRINNMLALLAEKLNEAKDGLARLENQQQAAKDELSKPFHLADELAEKELRLAELNAQLNLDGGRDVEEAAENEDVSEERVPSQLSGQDFSNSAGDYDAGTRTDFGSDASRHYDEIAV